MPSRSTIPRFSDEIEQALQQVMQLQQQQLHQQQQQQQHGGSSNNNNNNNATSAAASAGGGGDAENKKNKEISLPLPPPHPSSSSSSSSTSTSSATATVAAAAASGVTLGDTTSSSQQQKEQSSSSSSSSSGSLTDLSAFDQPNFSAVDFVNRRFSDEGALDGLGSYIEEVRRRLSDTESALLDAVRVQACTAATAGKDLDQAKSAVLQLRKRVEQIKHKADHSEETVVSICSSIRQLDNAKTNLTESIVTINQLQLFLRAVQGLDRAMAQRNYASVNDLLRQALRYNEKFEPYFDVPKVKELSVKLTALKRRVSNAVVTDILHELCPTLRRYSTNANHQQLGEEGLVHACLVVDALGAEVVDEVRKEFIGSQLEEYTAYLFKRGSEAAALEKTERRFIWFRQLLEKHEHLFFHVFPLHWYVMQEMCVEFCMKTSEELKHQLRFESSEVEVAVLIYMLQKTMDAEKDLTSRMKWYEIELKDKIKSDLEQEQKQLKQQKGTGESSNALTSSSSANIFKSSLSPKSPRAVPDYDVRGFMTCCFDDYLDKYVQHEDESMRTTIDTQLESDSINDELLVLQSTQDIFLFIQESMRRAATITSSRSQTTLRELCGVWHRHLTDYSKTLHKLAARVPASKEDERMMCVIVNSADYCRSAAEGLGGDLFKVLEEDREQVSQTHADVVSDFSQVCTYSSTQLAETVCANLGQLVNEYQSYLSSGAQVSGSAHFSVEAIDDSFFPGSVRRVLNDHFTNFATFLLPNLFSFVMTKTATMFIPKLNRLLYRPKGGRLTEAVVNQMRVDMGPLERAFSAAPNVAMNAAREATQNPFSTKVLSGGGGGGINKASAAAESSFTSPAYSKTVRREFGRIIAALRVLQLPPGESFVEGYYHTVDKEDRSEMDCRRLLELLGVSKEDQRQFIALLIRRGDVPSKTRRDDVITVLGGSTAPNEKSSSSSSSSASSAGSSGAGGGGQSSSVGSRFVSLFTGDDHRQQQSSSSSSSLSSGNPSNSNSSSASATAAASSNNNNNNAQPQGEQDTWSKFKSTLFNRK